MMFLVTRINLCHCSWQILRLEPLLSFIIFLLLARSAESREKEASAQDRWESHLTRGFLFSRLMMLKESIWDQGMVPPQSQQIEFHLIIHKPTIRYVAMIVQLGLCFGYVSKFSPYTSCIWFFFNFFQASAFKISLRKLNSFIKIW